MTTIIRVKRHRGEDPVEALVLSCKRKRTEGSGEENAESFKKILNYSGTVEEKDDKIATSTVESFAKGSKPTNLKAHVPEIRSKQRNEWKKRSEDSRFTLLSCLRANKDGEIGESDSSGDKIGNITIVDVSKENGDPSSEQNADDSFVYDIYSAHFEDDSEFDDLSRENILRIMNVDHGVDYACRNGEDCFEDNDPDEDDSNDENNWRNDYPDTDSDMEENSQDEILTKQLKGFHLDDSYELSCDSDEEDYLNYKDDDYYHYYEAEDLAGWRYARYKANAMKHLMDENDIEIKSAKSDESEDEFRDCEVLSFHENSD